MGFEQRVRGDIWKRTFKCVDHQAIYAQALFDIGRAADIATQPFEPGAFVHFTGIRSNPGMQ
jgi:hypothetical protein